METLPTTQASEELSVGTNIFLKPFSLARIAAGKTPFVERNFPSSEISPIKILEETSDINCPEAKSIPRAIGKSNEGPSFGRSAGARLTVIRRLGKLAQEFFIAARTRSFDSSTALSGSPTIEKAGKPEESILTSTSIKTGFKPTVATEL